MHITPVGVIACHDFRGSNKKAAVLRLTVMILGLGPCSRTAMKGISKSSNAVVLGSQTDKAQWCLCQWTNGVNDGDTMDEGADPALNFTRLVQV